MTVRQLTESVGEQGRNDLDDVFTVQMLLNHVDHGSGGPDPQLAVDGLIGPKTISAIRAFQQKQLGFQDGRVDPGGRTYTALLGLFEQPDAFSDGLLAGIGAPAVHRLVYRDVRLEGTRPAGDTVIEVDANTPLQWFLDSARDDAKATASPVRLKLMAHGRSAFLLFCTENLTLASMPRLRALRGTFTGGVDLFTCSIAFIGPGPADDGNVFCSRLAQTLNAFVRASTAPQFYTLGTAGTGLDFGRWEGTVLTYGPAGNVVNVESAPAF